MNTISTSGCALITSLTTETTPIEIVNQIKTEIKTKQFQKGEYIFVAGQEIQSVVAINSGLVKMYYMDHFGNEFTLKILTAGDVIGHRHVLDNDTFNGYLQALENTEICTLSKSYYSHLIDTEITMCKRLIELLCSDLRLAKEIIAFVS